MASVRFAMRRATWVCAWLALCSVSLTFAESPDPIAALRRIDSFAFDAPSFAHGKTIEEWRHLRGFIQDVRKTLPAPSNPSESTYKQVTIGLVGLRIVGWLSDGSHVQPVRIEITSKRWSLAGGLGVGAPAERIRQVLGRGSTVGPDGTIEYAGEAEHIYFGVRNGFIARVVFDYYFE